MRLRESQYALTQCTAQIQELQDKINSMSESRDFQDEVCSSRLSYVPSQPGIVSNPCGIPSRDQCQRLDTRILLGISGDVFENSVALIQSPTSIRNGLLHGRYLLSSFNGSVFRSTESLSRNRGEEHRANAEIPREVVNLEFSILHRRNLYAKLHG